MSAPTQTSNPLTQAHTSARKRTQATRRRVNSPSRARQAYRQGVARGTAYAKGRRNSCPTQHMACDTCMSLHTTRAPEVLTMLVAPPPSPSPLLSADLLSAASVRVEFHSPAVVYSANRLYSIKQHWQYLAPITAFCSSGGANQSTSPVVMLAP